MLVFVQSTLETCTDRLSILKLQKTCAQRWALVVQGSRRRIGPCIFATMLYKLFVPTIGILRGSAHCITASSPSSLPAPLVQSFSYTHLAICLTL